MLTGIPRNPATRRFGQFLPPSSSLDGLLGKSLLDYAHRRTVKRGHQLIAQGDPSAYVIFIEEGNVLAVRSSEAGKEVAVSFLGPGGACGLEDAMSGQPYSCEYQVMASGIIWCMLAGELRMLTRDFPALAQAVIGYMADRMRSATEHVELVTLEDLSTRVKKVLAQCASHMSTANGSVLLPLTQSQLAALVGASRQRINAVLADLHRMGLVESRSRGIVIRDSGALQIASGETRQLSRK